MNPTPPPPSRPDNAFSITALVLGCCSVFFFWLYGIVPILAIIFGGVAIRRAKQHNLKPSGMAVAGLVLGIVFTAITVLAFIVGLASVA